MLTPEEIMSYEQLGYVRLAAAFPPDVALSIQDFMWSELKRRFGFDREDPSTWTLEGWKPHEWTRLKLQETSNNPIYDGIASPRLMTAYKQLTGPEGAALKKSWGAFLVSFPEDPKKPWDVFASNWHYDWNPSQDLDSLRPLVVRTFTFYSHVAPGGGGTLLVEGSHRLVLSFHEKLGPDELTKKKEAIQARFLRSHPWLAELSGRAPDRGDRIRRFIDESTTIEGVTVRIAELTGEPGDVVFCHPAILHSRSYNRASVPRFMRA